MIIYTRFEQPLPQATVLMDCLSARERTEALDTAAAAAAFAALPSFAPLPHEQETATATSYPAAPLPDLSPMPGSYHHFVPSHQGLNFPERLYQVISSGEHADVITWLPHGRAFVIPDKRLFAVTVLPRYFEGCKWTSFTRRLKRWHFARTSRGREVGAYRNENFVRGRPELIQNMGFKMEGRFRIGRRKGGEGNEQAKLQMQVSESKKDEEANKNSSPTTAYHQVLPVIPQNPAYPAFKAMYFTDPDDPVVPNPVENTADARHGSGVASTLANFHPTPTREYCYGYIPEVIWPKQHLTEGQLESLSLPDPPQASTYEAQSGRTPYPSSIAIPTPHHPYAGAPAVQNVLSVECAEVTLESFHHQPQQNSCDASPPGQDWMRASEPRGESWSDDAGRASAATTSQGGDWEFDIVEVDQGFQPAY